MTILIVGRGDGWMGVHMGQVAEGFRRLGHTVHFTHYPDFYRRPFPAWPRRKSSPAFRRACTRRLLDVIRTHRPQVVILALAHLIFDMPPLRQAFPGRLIFWDLDGPALPCYREGVAWTAHLDLLATVSQVTRRRLEAAGCANVAYLPHGVDTAYYAPRELSAAERRRLGAPVAFVGRPTARRAAYLESIVDAQPGIWGARWSTEAPYRGNALLRPLVRGEADIVGEDLVKAYCASGVVVNILREPFRDASTIMNLQVFSVPAAEGCLVTEWVEEIEAAFEPGAELLTYRTLEEFGELVRRYTREREAARRIAAAGRRRCLAEHDHRHRAQALLALVGEARGRAC
jgi:hypothetical protein